MQCSVPYKKTLSKYCPDQAYNPTFPRNRLQNPHSESTSLFDAVPLTKAFVPRSSASLFPFLLSVTMTQISLFAIFVDFFFYKADDFNSTCLVKTVLWSCTIEEFGFKKVKNSNRTKNKQPPPNPSLCLVLRLESKRTLAAPLHTLEGRVCCELSPSNRLAIFIKRFKRICLTISACVFNELETVDKAKLCVQEAFSDRSSLPDQEWAPVSTGSPIGNQGGGSHLQAFMPGMNHAVGRAEGVSLLTAFHLDFGYG